MNRRLMIGLAWAAGSLHLSPTCLALSSDFVQRGEKATAFVDIDTAEGRASGSAFCISDKGIFITDGHVVMPAKGKIKVVLHPGEKDERVLEAQVLGIDYTADLAVIKTDGISQSTVLTLGNSDALEPTQEVTAFGYPFGNMLSVDKNTYPSVSVNSGKVTALRKEKGDLSLIQMDALVNPGNSGGPVLDAQGRVIGIVESGVPGAGLNFATPAAKLKKMLAGPLMVMSPASIDYAARNKQQTFSVHVTNLSHTAPDYEVSLKITDAKGTVQTVTGKTSKGQCDLQIIPTVDSAPIKWDPFTQASPGLKFAMTLTDPLKVVTTQQGTLEINSPPMSDDIIRAIGGRIGDTGKPVSMDPLPPDATETELIGSQKESSFREAKANEQVMKAVLYTTGQGNGGKSLFSSIRLGNARGTRDKVTTIMAKEGYVVGGLIIDASQFVNGFEVIFIRRKNGKLEPGDTYKSDWVGSGSADKAKQLAGNGERVVGLTGRKGVFLRALGLVIEKDKNAPSTQPTKK